MRPALFAFLLHLLLATAGAVEMREVRWGFDGSVVPDRLNLLSVRFANPGNTAVETVAEVRERGPLPGGRGAPFALPLYLAPGAERWLQFYVWITRGRDDFTLRCGRQDFDVRIPPLGPPARIILSEGSPVHLTVAPVQQFPETLFPLSVSACDGLDAVALDHAPQWSAEQTAAFLDWVRLGGNVLLLRGTDGAVPAFTGALEVLNASADRTQLGAGRVIVTSLRRTDLTAAAITALGLTEPSLPETSSSMIPDLNVPFFARLASLTRPKIRWWLVTLFTLVYLVVIGPLQYRWSRRLDHRWSIAIFLGTVAIFSAALAVIGRRGYGETQTVHSLGIARALGAGRHDVTQWISAFATRGGVYALSHGAPVNFYAAPSPEPIEGQIVNGRDGQFAAEFPVFSSRQFLHRGVLSGDDTAATIEEWKVENQKLRTLALKVGANFPAEALDLRLRYRDLFYRLERTGDRLVMAKSAPPEPLDTFLPMPKVLQATTILPAFLRSQHTDPREELKELLPLLQTAALAGRPRGDSPADSAVQRPDRAELWIFAPVPDGFRLRGGFERENGFVLYVQDLAAPAAR